MTLVNCLSSGREKLPCPPIKNLVYGMEIVSYRGSKIDEGCGNGFLVSNDGWLVTAAHNIDVGEGFSIDSSESYIYGKDGSEYHLECVQRHRTLDIALVKLHGFAGDDFQINFGQPHADDEIMVYSLLDQNVLAKRGKVISPRLRRPSEEMFLFKDRLIADVVLSEGQSGSPYISSGNEVLGMGLTQAEVSIRGRKAAPYRSGGARVDEIEKFIRKVARRYSP